MEEKINIAEILKDKQKGLNLYSPVYGKVKFEAVHKDKIYFYHDMNEHSVKSNGKSFDDGEVVIFPSQEMRDWSKFAWKKGDILVNKDAKVHIIFDGFDDDTYKNFHGQYYLWEEGGSIVSFEEDENYMQTSDFNKANKEDAQEYINKIEKELGGKLNMETLEIEEIEKQPEFKDGDIVALMVRKCTHIAIFQSRQETYIGFHAVLCNNEQLLLEEPFREDDGDIELRPATDSEKMKLFEALVREGKRWNPDKLQIEDLPKKCEFYPFDKVLVRDTKDELWRPAFFASFDEHCITEYAYGLIGDPEGVFCKYCIPYNEETAHLLGTTDDWKGGEG